MRRTITSRGYQASVVGGLGAAAWIARHVTAPAVRGWSPGSGVRERLGRLQCRTHGEGSEGVVLLHGLVSSGDQFGAQYDSVAQRARVLVPDLLGFGGSCDPASDSFTLDDHLQALEDAIEAAGLHRARLTFAGHSFGAILALHLAERRSSQADRVVMWSPPIASDPARAKAAIRRMGLFERLFALEGPLSRTACQWMCRHRRAAALLALIMNPTVPAELSLGSVRHTWPAYRDSMNSIVLDQRWEVAMRHLCDAQIPVVVAAGDHDDVSDDGFNRTLGRRHSNVTVRTPPPGAGHLLPITHADWCVAQLYSCRDRHHSRHVAFWNGVEVHGD